MNAATALSLVASAIELVFGTLALAFAAAPGWRYFKIFAWVAFTGAIYGAGDAFIAYAHTPSSVIPWVGRLNVSVAFLHCAAWIAYVRRQYDDPLRRVDRYAIGVLGALALLSLWPGALLTDRVVTEFVLWAGVTYHVPVVTSLGSLLVALGFPLSLMLPVVGYVQKARAGAPGARTHLLGFSIFYASVLNETLVVVGAIDNLYLVDLGFLAAILSVSADFTYRVTADARRLQALSSDLTRQVEERTQELSETRDNLLRAERLAALGRLSASVGHEINNPLSYVIGNLEYVSRELSHGRMNDGVHEALRDAASGADRIRRIVHELRAFVRGSDRDRRELVELREVLDASVKLVWSELRHRARLERELDEVPKLLADPIRLTQVFVNVLMNAVQAIPEERVGRPESVITLRARQLSPAQIAIEIEDTGVGIAESDRARLFEPFFSTKPQDKGTGLGLFVSLGIVSALGGRIDVDSREGRGTLVRVVLPIPEGVTLPMDRVSSMPPPSVKNRRLLVVDDDVLVARTLARLLSEHRVEVVTSGRDALQRLATEGSAFDLVLCDLMMPDITGMDVYEEVERKHPGLLRASSSSAAAASPSVRASSWSFTPSASCRSPSTARSSCACSPSAPHAARRRRLEAMKKKRKRQRTALQCPFCGEAEDVFVDLGGGTSQEYVEDCAVCCRPRVVHVEPAFGEEGAVQVWLERAD
ncbi:MAG: CPXCG motif-containing cysteine-rich protein [Polyangiaceae bacterium]